MAPTFKGEWKQLLRNLRGFWPWLGVAAAVGHAASLSPAPAALASFGVLAFFLVFLAAEDLKTQTLPNLLTLPMAVAGLAAAVLGTAPATPQNALMGVVAGGLFFLFIAILSLKILKKPGMGVGDIKLLAAGGAWVGVTGLPLVLIIASVAALLYILLARIGRGVKIAFGPFLALGIWLAVMYQPQLWGYLFALTAPSSFAP